MTKKQKLRSLVKQKILSCHNKDTQSKKICHRLKHNPIIKESNIIACFDPLWTEPNIKPCIDQREKEGKIIVMPTSTSKNSPTFRLKWLEEVYLWEIHAFIIPWIAFTKSWKRLWRGWWRYDRALSHYPTSYKIWVCFDIQIYWSFDSENHDIDMNLVISWP